MGRPRARQRLESRPRPDPWSGPFTALQFLSRDGAAQPPAVGTGVEFARAPSGDLRFRPAAVTARGASRVWPVAWCDFLDELDKDVVGDGKVGSGGRDGKDAGDDIGDKGDVASGTLILAGDGIAALFRALIAEVSTRNYHFRAVPCEDRGFRIECLAGRIEKGPVVAGRCMSCDLGASLRAGLHGDDAMVDGSAAAESADAAADLTSADTLLHEGGGVRVWLDAKARNMLIVTPLRHVESMEDMTDGELRELWVGCADAVRREELSAEAVLAMICNSGHCMNHAHLHVKLKLDGAAFSACRKRWPPETLQRWDRLAAFAIEAARPRLDRVLASAPENIKTVFVGELDSSRMDGGRGAAEKKLRECCADFGTVHECKVVPHKKCAFITFASHDEAAKSIVGMYRRRVVEDSELVPFYAWSRR